MNANSERYRWSDPQLHFAETKSLALIIGFSVNKIFALEKSSAEIGHCVMHQKMRKGACTAVHFSPEAILSIMVKLKMAKKSIYESETWHALMKILWTIPTRGWGEKKYTGPNF